MNLKSEPVILIANQRSGTNVFRSALAKNRNFENFNETFQKNESVYRKELGFFLFKQRLIEKEPHLIEPTGENQTKIFECYLEMLSRHAEESRYFILDVKYNSLHHFNTVWHSTNKIPYLISLIEKNQIKVIHLTRRNIFKQVISRMFAVRTNTFGITNKENLPEYKMKVDPELLYTEMVALQQNIGFVKKWLVDYDNVLNLAYEDLFENGIFSEEIGLQLSGFLNTDVKLRGDVYYKKMITQVSNVIMNFDEIRDYFKGTEFEDLVCD